MLEISVLVVRKKLDAGEPIKLIDVREAQEIAICALENAQHIPMMQLFTQLTKPDAEPGDEIVVFCHTGIRSLDAAQFLRNQGFENSRSMAGGIDAWAVEIEPGMARY